MATPLEQREMALALLGDDPGFDPRKRFGGPPGGMEGIRRATARDVSYGPAPEMPQGTGRGAATGTLTRTIDPIEKAGPLSRDFRDLMMLGMARRLGLDSGGNSAQGDRLIQYGIQTNNPMMVNAGVALSQNASEGSRFDRQLSQRERLANLSAEREDNRFRYSQEAEDRRFGAHMQESSQERELRKMLGERGLGLQESASQQANENARRQHELALANMTQQGGYQNAMLGLEGQKIKQSGQQFNEKLKQEAASPALQVIGAAVQSGDLSWEQALPVMGRILMGGDPNAMAGMGGGTQRLRADDMTALAPALEAQKRGLFGTYNAQVGRHIKKIPAGFVTGRNRDAVERVLVQSIGPEKYAGWLSSPSDSTSIFGLDTENSVDEKNALRSRLGYNKMPSREEALARLRAIAGG